MEGLNWKNDWEGKGREGWVRRDEDIGKEEKKEEERKGRGEEYSIRI